MVQEAYLRWPSRDDLTSLLPGGTPSRYGVPPGAQLLWDWSGDGFPLLRVEPDQPVGERFVFSLADVLAESAIEALDLDRHYAKWLRRLSWPLRRLVLSLSIIPVAWTAPAPDEPPQEATAMTTPSPVLKPIAGGVRVVHRLTCSGQNIFMSHGAVMTGPGTVAHLQALANAARDAFLPEVMENTVPAATYVECAAYDLSAEAGATAVAVGTGVGLTGTAASALQVAAIVQWRTARAGRSYRGRTFMGPIAAEALNTDGRTLKAQYRTNFQNAWTGYRTAVNAATGTNGAVVAVLSQTLGVATPVTDVQVGSVIGTQRGRLR